MPERTTFLVSTSDGVSFRASRSNCQMRSCLSPPVASAASVVFIHLTVSAVSCAAGAPQMALPVSTFQMTRLLSSGPPTEARYLPLKEKSSACTITLCSRSRFTSVGAVPEPSHSPEMSQMMISAR